MRTCKNCGLIWVDKVLKEEGIYPFSFPSTTQKIVELDGRYWEIAFEEHGDVLGILHCKQCPISLGIEIEE